MDPATQSPGFAERLQQIPGAVIVAGKPREVTVAHRVAIVPDMPVAVGKITVGGLGKCKMAITVTAPVPSFHEAKVPEISAAAVGFAATAAIT